ncbi:MAG: hypothetical protein N2043_02345 [Ignavibacterium sp.]|nr:hypothetical protein [Ignavibacterium sp.]
MISKKQKDYALFGLYLSRGTYNNGSVIVYSKNDDYISFLSYLLSRIKMRFFLKKEGDKNILVVFVCSKRHFHNYNRALNENNEKYPSSYMLRRMNVLGLFLFYISSGKLFVVEKESKVYRYALISLSFNRKQDVMKIKHMLQKRFGINSKVINKDSMFFLKLNATELKRMFFLFEREIPFVYEKAKQTKKINQKFDLQYRRVNPEAPRAT